MLEEKNLLNNIKYILGTSIGSIIGSFLCCSNVNFIIENIKSFICLSYNDINLRLLIDKYGLISKDNMINNIEKLFLVFFEKNPTFYDLYKFSNKELTISSANISSNKIDYFNYKNNPDMLVTKAIALSINIPFLFNKETYKDHIYVDGGILNNFSWEYYNNVDNKNKIGIYLKLIKNEENNKVLENMMNYIFQIFKTIFIYSTNQYELTLDKNLNIIYLCDSSSIFDIQPTKEKINNMIQFGYEQTKYYLKKSL